MNDAEREAIRLCESIVSSGYHENKVCMVCKPIKEAIESAEKRGRDEDPMMTKTFPDGTSETHPRSRLIKYLDFQVEEQYRKGLLRGAEIAERMAVGDERLTKLANDIAEAIRKEYGLHDGKSVRDE